MRQNIDAVVDTHQSAVAALASAIGEGRPDRMALERTADQVRANSPDLQALFAANSSGAILGASLEGVPEGAVAITQSQGIGRVRDNNYFRQTLATGSPVVSEVMWYRAGSAPVIYLTAPIRGPGGIDGLVAGALRIRAFHFDEDSVRLSRYTVIIVDGLNQVVYAKGPESSRRCNRLKARRW